MSVFCTGLVNILLIFAVRLTATVSLDIIVFVSVFIRIYEIFVSRKHILWGW